MGHLDIGPTPPYPADPGMVWEKQCARCGSSLDDDDLCLSSEEWCRTHPIEGREDVERGEIEWFEVEDVWGERRGTR